MITEFLHKKLRTGTKLQRDLLIALFPLNTTQLFPVRLFSVQTITQKDQLVQF